MDAIRTERLVDLSAQRAIAFARCFFERPLDPGSQCDHGNSGSYRAFAALFAVIDTLGHAKQQGE